MDAPVMIGILTFLTILGLGGTLIGAIAARRQPIRERLGLGSGPLRPRDLVGPERGVGRFVAGFGRIFLGGSGAREIQALLAGAGLHGNKAAPLFMGAKMVLFFGGLGGIALLTAPLDLTLANSLLLVMVGAAVLSWIPNLVVRQLRKARSAEMRRGLPNAIDLLEVCVSSGMGVEMAWNAVTDEIRGVSRHLADEMALTNLETHLGRRTAEAMKSMGERTKLQEMSSLAAVFLQTERFGTSIAQALRTFAESMREERGEMAREEAEKIPVKLLFPMALFIFPVMFIVILGPAGIRLYDAFSTM